MSGLEPSPSSGPRSGTGDARERILASAYELFSRRGIRAVGIESIIAHSGVARQTLYRHFASKQELVLAFLERREELWTKGWLRGEVERRADDPAERLLAIFDVFDEWFRRDDYEGCSFINVMLEHADPEDPIHSGGAAISAASGPSSRAWRATPAWPTRTASPISGTSS